MWWSLAAAKGDKNAINNLPILAKRMTPAEITKAKKLAREWQAKRRKK